MRRHSQTQRHPILQPRPVPAPLVLH
ncbi:hypothetical protein E2C01_095698 [Portunus trituberculatus]|uniref:Uncharacterized protein n=1 Tax=Portunus trituberculatus TaxID=210409 RepID=A0A5B7K4P5_PORTR|nr:hypothetical protein [Portunus trituberculatus]